MFKLLWYTKNTYILLFCKNLNKSVKVYLYIQTVEPTFLSLSENNLLNCSRLSVRFKKIKRCQSKIKQKAITKFAARQVKMSESVKVLDVNVHVCEKLLIGFSV